MNSSSRVILNVVIQYIRTFLSVIIALYTSRVIIDALGEVDFGIYSLLAGIVFMLSFIQSSLSSTTQRFLSFHAGNNDIEKQKSFFQNSLFIQISSALFLVLVLAAIMPLLFNGFLNIPDERIQASIYVYVMLLFILMMMLFSTPYLAVLIARENMLYMSIVLLLVSILKVPIAISLYYIGGDRLVAYLAMLLAVQVLEFILLFVYCRKKYFETQDVSLKSFDWSIIKEIFSFMGWSIYSTFCVVGRTQGVAIVLNKFFGSAVNASYGIAFQVSGQLGFLSSSIHNAIKPILVRYEGAGERDMMLRMSEIMSKFSYLLLLSIAIPVVLEMPILLDLWLKEVPEHAVIMCQYIIIANVVDQLTSGLGFANEAVGKLKPYALIVSTTKILTIPLVIIALYTRSNIELVMCAILLIEFLCAMLRLPVLSKQAGLSIICFSKNVFIPIILPSISAISLCIAFVYYIDWQYRFLFTTLISLSVVFITTYLLSLDKVEREIIREMTKKISGRFIRNKKK